MNDNVTAFPIDEQLKVEWANALRLTDVKLEVLDLVLKTAQQFGRIREVERRIAAIEFPDDAVITRLSLAERSSVTEPVTNHLSVLKTELSDLRLCINALDPIRELFLLTISQLEQYGGRLEAHIERVERLLGLTE